MTSKFDTNSSRKGPTAAGLGALALASVLLLCGAGNAPLENFTPQGPMQADLNAGGHNITNAATLSATTATVGTLNATSLSVGAKSLTVSNALTLAGTDGSTLNIGAGGTLGGAAFVSTNSFLAPAAIGTTVQGYNANTTTLGNTVNAANDLARRDGSNRLDAGAGLTMGAASPVSADFLQFNGTAFVPYDLFDSTLGWYGYNYFDQTVECALLLCDGGITVAGTSQFLAGIVGSSGPAQFGGFEYTLVSTTGSTTQAVVGQSYLATGATQSVYLLPTGHVLGTTVTVFGPGSGGWKITENTSQKIQWLTNFSTTSTGNLTGTQGCAVTLLCTDTTTWLVIAHEGSLSLN